MTKYDQKSLDLHEKHGGKIGIAAKIPLVTREDLSAAYTPGVAAVSLAIAQDASLAHKYTMKKNSVAVVTDGSAVLGLGNIGPEAALPVMEGKAALFSEFGGVDAFPICLATQDTEEIIRTVEIIAPSFGGINLEDISAPRCFEIEKALMERLTIPVMHDDQHGTAIVVLAGLINALKLRATTEADARIVINGAGAAGLAITDLLIAAGFSRIIVVDSKGAIFEGRGYLDGEKEAIAKTTNRQLVAGSLETALSGADVFIGVSRAGLLSASAVSVMNDRPIIFALANPDPEIMPEEALAAGAFIVATGRSDYPNQINNVLAFPGLFRGALDVGIKRFDRAMFLRAARALASHIDPTPDRILPDPLDKTVAKSIADAVSQRSA